MRRTVGTPFARIRFDPRVVNAPSARPSSRVRGKPPHADPTLIAKVVIFCLN